jgi:hypothetical protein
MNGILMAVALLVQGADMDAAKEMEKRIQDFMDRVKVETEKIGGADFHRLKVDGKLLFRDFGAAPKLEVVNDGKTIKITQDGKVVLQVDVPDLGKPFQAPPLSVKEAASCKVEGKAVNGQVEVTVDGKVVYKGPGKSVSSKATVESKDGKTRRFVEVYVDGKLVYRAGEAIPDADKKNKDDYAN